MPYATLFHPLLCILVLTYIVAVAAAAVAAAVFGGRVSPALVKIVTGPGGLLQPAVFKGDGGGTIVTSASSWAVSSWVESENFGLVSEFSPDNFAMYA